MKLSMKLLVVLVLIVMAIPMAVFAAEEVAAPAVEEVTAEQAEVVEEDLPPIVGVWKLDLAALNELLGADTAAFENLQYRAEDLSITVEFTKDGKVITTVTAFGEESVHEDTYTATYEEGNYRVSINGGEPYYFSIEDNVLTIVAHAVAE